MSAAAILFMGLLAFPDETSRKEEQRRQFLEFSERSSKSAQPKQVRYDPVPLQGNIDSFVKQLLLNSEDDEELRKLFEQLRGLTKVDRKLLEQLKASEKDPWKRPELIEQARRLNAGGGLSSEDLKNLQALIERWRGGGEIRAMPFDPIPNGRGPASLPEPPADDKLARWAKDLLKDVDHSRAGDFLRDSPAWQNGLRDLDKLVKPSEFKFDWLRGRVPESVKLPQGWLPKLGDWTSRLPGLQSLPRWRFNPPNLGRFNVNLGRGGGGGFSAPSLGGAGVSDNAWWLLLPVLLALLAWFFYRNLGRTPASAVAARLRGPWPVDPATVTTRTQLIQAFDYLALLLLGEQARTWNHVVVSQRLGDAAARSPAAGALAQLYELARYTPGYDALTPEARDAARRHLLFLARSAAA